MAGHCRGLRIEAAVDLFGRQQAYTLRNRDTTVEEHVNEADLKKGEEEAPHLNHPKNILGSGFA
jgi:hypothetical protein